MPKPYRIELTRAELIWLGVTLGCLRFPLLIPVGTILEPRQMQMELHQGEESLLKRVLVKKPVRNQVHIDAVLLALVEGLCSPSRSVLVETVTLFKPPPSLVVHAFAGTVISVLIQDANYKLTLFPDLASFLPTLIHRLGLADDVPIGLASLRLPCKQPLQLVRLALLAPLQAGLALRAAGQTSIETEHTLSWLTSSRSASLVTSYHYVDGDPVIADQVLTVQDQAYVSWCGAQPDGEAKSFELHASPAAAILGQLLGSFLQNTVEN